MGIIEWLTAVVKFDAARRVILSWCGKRERVADPPPPHEAERLRRTAVILPLFLLCAAVMVSATALAIGVGVWLAGERCLWVIAAAAAACWWCDYKASRILDVIWDNGQEQSDDETD